MLDASASGRRPALEILRFPKTNPWPDRTPLLFVHGSFCAAWVWAEHFMPWLAERGVPSIAVSLRGHGGSGGDLHAAGLADYVEDVATAAASLDRPPVLVGNSLGGLVAQRYAQEHPVAGLALLASVPPSGLGHSAMHMAMVAPELLWQVQLLQTFGPRAVNPAAMYRAIFSDKTPQAEVERFAPLLQQESRRANAELMFPALAPVSRRDAPPTLVVGGDKDKFLPLAAFRETAAFWHGDLTLLPGHPHGLMLDAQWEEAAETLLAWLEKRGF